MLADDANHVEEKPSDAPSGDADWAPDGRGRTSPRCSRRPTYGRQYVPAYRLGSCGDPLGFVYFIAAPAAGLIKIGETVGLEKRSGEVRTMSPVPVSPLAIMYGGPTIETLVHNKFADLRSHGEWFRVAPELDAFIGDIASPWPSFDSPRSKSIFLPIGDQSRIIGPLIRMIGAWEPRVGADPLPRIDWWEWLPDFEKWEIALMNAFADRCPAVERPAARINERGKFVASDPDPLGFQYMVPDPDEMTVKPFTFDASARPAPRKTQKRRKPRKPRGPFRKPIPGAFALIDEHRAARKAANP